LRGWGGEGGVEWVVREGVGAQGRNDPSLVCTYELKKYIKKFLKSVMRYFSHHSEVKSNFLMYYIVTEKNHVILTWKQCYMSALFLAFLIEVFLYYFFVLFCLLMVCFARKRM
jgi:hypothetical protein